MDDRCSKFLRVDYDRLKERVLSGGSDEEFTVEFLKSAVMTAGDLGPDELDLRIVRAKGEAF